jgi:hypothetical protein
MRNRRTSRSGASGNWRDFCLSASRSRACLLQVLGRVDIVIHVPLALKLGGRLAAVVLGPEVVAARLVAPLDERRVDVDEVLQRQAAIDEALHDVHPVPLHVRADAVAVVGHLVHHLAVRAAEADVVLEKIIMSINVGHDELLIDPHVAAQEVGVARVGVDDHLVDLLEPVAVALGELLVLHAEPPVRVAGGNPPRAAISESSS